MMLRDRALVILSLATAAFANDTCNPSLPAGLSYGTYSGNPQCHSGGSDAPLGFDFGYKMTGCKPGTFNLGSGGEIKGSCAVASDITVTVACNSDKSATISWSGLGDSKLAIKMKGSNGGTLYDSSDNGGNYIVGRNGGGNIADISHIEFCVNCVGPDCGGAPPADPEPEPKPEPEPQPEPEPEPEPAPEGAPEPEPEPQPEGGTCNPSLPAGLSYGTYSGNPQCHSGGSDAPLGFDFGYKMTGCKPGTFNLGSGGEIKGSCAVASDITVTVACNSDKSATISWSGLGDSKLAIKMKGSNGGTLYDSSDNGGNYIVGRNGGGNIADISHIEFCVNCVGPDCGGAPPADPEPEPEPEPEQESEAVSALEESVSALEESVLALEESVSGTESNSGLEDTGSDKSGGGFAQNTCSVPEWVPQDNTASPTGMVRCCAGQHGKDGKEYGKCDTSSCVNNFNAKNRNCFNYGAPQNGKNAKDNQGSAICPYADSDHAICDTSFYDALNPEACRTNSNGKNYQVHCLGKVKCNTIGVKVPKNGHSDGTAPYDDSGETECLGAMEGFKAGDDCFYDGASENWKVCEGEGAPPAKTPYPTPVPTRSPTPNPTANPTPLPTPIPTAKPSPSPTPIPTPSPTRVEENEYWSLTTSDECVVDGPCIKSHPTAGLTDYMTDELCNFQAKKDGSLVAKFFETESCCDHVTINGKGFSGSGSGVTETLVTAGTPVVWDSDKIVVHKGFEICYAPPTEAPTGEPTASPTKSPTKAPTGEPTSSPTATPTSLKVEENEYWSLTTTDECVIVGPCIKSHPTAGVTDYNSDELCNFKAKKSGSLVSSVFDTEIGYDWLSVDGVKFSGIGHGLTETEVSKGTAVVWDSDSSVVKKGFEVCYAPPTPSPTTLSPTVATGHPSRNPTPSPTRVEENEYWSLSTSDECVIDGPCIQSHPTAGLTDYMNDELCNFLAKKDGSLAASFFDTEGRYDWLSVDGVKFSGSGSGLAETSVTAGTPVVWDTDSSVVKKGFKVCYAPPTEAPTGEPTSSPTKSPTDAPTDKTTSSPTATPTSLRVEENEYWSLITSDECIIDGPCIQSHRMAGLTDYMNDELCNFEAKKDGSLVASLFDTEGRYDWLSIAGAKFSGSGSGLSETEVTAGTPVVWDSDSSVVRKGFKVCYAPPTPSPTPNPTPSPTPKATPAPTPAPKGTPPGSFGDPHIKTWGGQVFDFHGQCDLVLLENPSFHDGLGMSIHIRTKIVTWWSYIESAVLRIGNETVEVSGGDRHRYYVNGIEGDSTTEDSFLLSGFFPVKVRRSTNHQLGLRVELFNADAISIESFKEFVRVNLREVDPKWKKFDGATGLMGTHPTGARFGRDGKTVFTDMVAFGKEWQVTQSEPMLFHTVDGPQHPTECVMPESGPTKLQRLRRRLVESAITEKDAELACAHVHEADRSSCIFDVLATNDKDMAGSY